MGISTCAVALLLALLGSLVDFVANIPRLSVEHGDRLTIYISKDEGEPKAETMPDDQAAPSVSQNEVVSVEPRDSEQEIVTAHTLRLPADSQPAKDWHAMAEEAAKTSVDEHFRNEEFRASMWRQSRSTMFQPASEFMLQEEEPIIPDFRFKPAIHVVGLGFTIGSCFIGIPLAGVPVEQRTVAISLFVCANDSG